MAVHFHVNGERIPAPGCGETPLSDRAAKAGFPLNMQCGGQGACRGCMVKLGAGSYRIAGTEIQVPGGESREARACKTIVLSDSAVIEIPESSMLRLGTCPAADFYTGNKPVFEAAEKDSGALGIAVDIGTTTVAALLVDLATGKILARTSAYNRQIELGTDVAARIALCREPGNVDRLRQLIIQETLAPMFRILAEESGQSPNAVTEIVFSGNTVMSHLALGLSALSMGTIPFEPLTKVFREHDAPEIGLGLCPNARVRTVPAVSGYVGGDIVSDLYSCKPSQTGVELIVDIGTNGEIVLNHNGQWTATAAAAGPAFEGAGLLHGARAGNGVIEEIICREDDSIDVKVIGDQPPYGLCGSAAVDFMATAFQTGLLNIMGRFDLDRLRAAGRLKTLEAHGLKINACVIAAEDESALEGPVLITEFDISQILKAKGAVYAGIRTLLDRSGIHAADISRFVLAGGFAAHLRIKNAIAIGLLPQIPLEKYDVIGNGSLAGAYAALSSPSVFDEFLQITQQPEALHLNETARFNDLYIDAMALPNLDPAEFPATQTKTG